jgi:MoaA/NifB/PqqE/SkfB family radical SAM enzyme
MSKVLSAKAQQAYNEHRPKERRASACWAAETSMYFGLQGDVHMCCLNRENNLGRYPDSTLLEMWNSAEAKQLRQDLRAGIFHNGCSTCYHFIENGNIAASKSLEYDRDTVNSEWPTRLDFEISNQCNLECSMCNGFFSSAIRRNREKLPPLPRPYDDAFLAQLEPFLPHVRKANFLGGEPFMIEEYLHIWERLTEVNRNAEIYVQTNGTILSDRVRRILEKLPMDIGLSFDSVHKETYERIRAGANFEKVVNNLDEIVKLTKRHKKNVQLTMCVMAQNWMELPDYYLFASKRNLSVRFLMVEHPLDHSLRNLPANELEAGFLKLKAAIAKLQRRFWKSRMDVANLNALETLLSNLEQWIVNEKDGNDFTLDSFLESMFGIYPAGSDQALDKHIIALNLTSIYEILTATGAKTALKNILLHTQNPAYTAELWLSIQWLKPEEFTRVFTKPDNRDREWMSAIVKERMLLATQQNH